MSTRRSDHVFCPICLFAYSVLVPCSCFDCRESSMRSSCLGPSILYSKNVTCAALGNAIECALLHGNCDLDGRAFDVRAADGPLVLGLSWVIGLWCV